MKKKRFGLLAKIVLLTGVLTLLTVSSSLTVNLLISYSDKKKAYTDACEIVTDNLEGVFAKEESDETSTIKFRSVLNMVINHYLMVRDSYDSLTKEDLHAYQRSLRLDEFGPSQPEDPPFGMTEEKSGRKTLFTNLLIDMQSVAFINEVPSSSFFLYDTNPSNPEARSLISVMGIHSESVRNNITSSSSSTIVENILQIGKKMENPKDEVFSFLDSGEDSKIFIIDKTVYSFNHVSIALSNTEFRCYVMGQYAFESVNKEFTRQLITQLVITLISATILVIFYALFTRLFLIRNVHKLTDSTNKFVGMMQNNEELSVVDSGVKTSDEIRELSDSFSVMQGQIITYVDNIKKAKDFENAYNAEVNVASKIQLESLPARGYFDRNLELRAFVKPARAVGGDFYDYFYIDNDHLAVVIADVSGKGIPASLFMMRSKESIRSTSMNEKDLASVFFKVNNSLCTNNKEGFFVTAFLGVLNLKTFDFNFISAGHERPFIKHANKVRRLEAKSNFVLGLEEDFVYEQEHIKLNEGDSILLYTDGLNEAINANKEEFGYDRIAASFEKDDDVKSNIETLIRDLEEFEGEEEQFDDITLVSFKLRKNVTTFFYKNPTFKDIQDLIDKVEQNLEGEDIAKVSKISIVIDEVMNNVISYGKTKTNKTLMVTLEKNKDEIALVFIDNSHPFNPLLKEKRTIPENIEQGIVGGVGISIVTSISKESEYLYSNNKNILIIKF